MASHQTLKTEELSINCLVAKAVEPIDVKPTNAPRNSFATWLTSTRTPSTAFITSSATTPFLRIVSAKRTPSNVVESEDPLPVVSALTSAAHTLRDSFHWTRQHWPPTVNSGQRLKFIAEV
jgi:hypothetical protein